MARFYGTLQGARGPTSRLGHANTGLRVTAQSFSGDIVVNLLAVPDDDGGADWVSIRACAHGSGAGVILYYGPVNRLVDYEGHDFLVHEMAQRALEEAHASD